MAQCWSSATCAENLTLEPDGPQSQGNTCVAGAMHTTVVQYTLKDVPEPFIHKSCRKLSQVSSGERCQFTLICIKKKTSSAERSAGPLQDDAPSFLRRTKMTNSACENALQSACACAYSEGGFALSVLVMLKGRGVRRSAWIAECSGPSTSNAFGTLPAVWQVLQRIDTWSFGGQGGGR